MRTPCECEVSNLRARKEGSVKILPSQKSSPHYNFRRRQWQPTPVLLPGISHGRRSLVGCSLWGRESRIQLSNFTFTFHFHALEKEMATHPSVLAWRIPGMGEPSGLPSMGSHRVQHDRSDLAAAAAYSGRNKPSSTSTLAHSGSFDVTHRSGPCRPRMSV